VGVIELAEGVRTSVMGLLRSDGLPVEVGDPVAVVFHATQSGQRVPWFEVSTPLIPAHEEKP
jgi:hypothetical protein